MKQLANNLDFDHEEMMVISKIKMIMKAKFWGVLTSQLQLVAVRPDHPYFRTAATDGKHLFYNPVFMKNIGEEGRQFVLAHEIGHIILMTLRRSGSRDFQVFNAASDFVINQMLVDAGFKMPTNKELNESVKRLLEEHGIDSSVIDFPDPGQVVGLYDPDKYGEMTAEEVYEELMKELQEQEKQKKKKDGGGGGKGQKGKGGDGEKDEDDAEGEGNRSGGSSDISEKLKELLGGTGLDQHLNPSEKNGDEDGEDGDSPNPSGGLELSEADARRWKAQINLAVEQCENKAAGGIPAGLLRLISELNEPTVNWRNVLATRALSEKMGDWDWVPPEHNVFGQGITLPRLQEEEHLDVAVVIDASGSISESELRDFLSEMLGIADQFPSWEMLVMSFDHSLNDPELYTDEDGSDVVGYSIKGGGGTSFSAPLDYLAGAQPHNGEFCEFEPHFVVFFTDGYPGEPDWCSEYQDDLEVIWVVTTPNITAPWGTTVKYDKYD